MWQQNFFTRPKHDFTCLGWVDRWLGRTLVMNGLLPVCHHLKQNRNIISWIPITKLCDMAFIEPMHHNKPNITLHNCVPGMIKIPISKSGKSFWKIPPGKFWQFYLFRGEWVNTLRLRQNGCHFPDDIFKCIFVNENVRISITIWLKFVTMFQHWFR